jgi:hypothetical protein
MSPRRIVTQDLLRHSSAAISATLRPRPFQDAQRAVMGELEQAQDRPGFITAQRTKGHGGQAQPARATIPLKTIEQYLGLLDLHPFQRLLDAALQDRSQKPFFQGRLLEPKPLVTQV